MRREVCGEVLLQTEFHPQIALQQAFPIQMKSGAVVIREWLSLVLSSLCSFPYLRFPSKIKVSFQNRLSVKQLIHIIH